MAGWPQSPALHTRAVVSSDAVTSAELSGAHAHALNMPVWPVRVARQLQSSALHTRAVRSPDAVTSAEPSGAHAHAFTSPVWPVRVARQLQSPRSTPASSCSSTW